MRVMRLMRLGCLAQRGLALAGRMGVRMVLGSCRGLSEKGVVMQVYRLEVLALVALSTAASAANLGCGPSSSSSSSGSTSSTSTNGAGSGGGGAMGSTSTQSSGAGSTTGSSTGMSSSGSGGEKYGYCSKPCTTAAECCPSGAKDCPSAKYPNNYTCVSGACVNPACSLGPAGTAECAAVNPKYDCFTKGGVRDCAFACTTDGDCTAPQTCVGQDDSGKKFCLAKGGGCTEAMCVALKIGHCIEGVCSCENDGECMKPGFDKCVK